MLTFEPARWNTTELRQIAAAAVTAKREIQCKSRSRACVGCENHNLCAYLRDVQIMARKELGIREKAR